MAKIELVRFTENGEECIEDACRVCYQSWHRKNPPQSTQDLIQKILKQGHFSVLEHASATFRLNDVSRVLTHELVRHRLMSPSQESQRYVCYADKAETDQPGIKGKARKKTKDFSYTTPPDIAEMDDAEWTGSFNFKDRAEIVAKIEDGIAYWEKGDGSERICQHRLPITYEQLIGLNYAYYEFLLSKGIKPEDARYILPNATNCDIYCTANLREWRHICYVRCHPAAAWEIRELMTSVKDILKIQFPNVFYDFPLGPLTEESYKEIIVT